MPTHNRVVYHEAKHETDIAAECTKIKLSTVTLHTCRYVASTAQDQPSQTLYMVVSGNRTECSDWSYLLGYNRCESVESDW